MKRQSSNIKITKGSSITSVSNENQHQADIQIIGAAAFNMVTQRKRRNKEGLQIGSLTMAQIDQELRKRNATELINDSDVLIPSLTMDEVVQKLPPKYRDLKKVFDQSKAKQLPPHRS